LMAGGHDQGTFQQGLVCLPAHSTQTALAGDVLERATSQDRVHVSSATCRHLPLSSPGTTAPGLPNVRHGEWPGGHESSTRACLDHTPLTSPTFCAAEQVAPLARVERQARVVQPPGTPCALTPRAFGRWAF